MPFKDEISDKEGHLVRGSFYTVINRVSYEAFGKSLLNHLIVKSPELLKLFPFANDNLASSKAYQTFAEQMSGEIERCAAWIDDKRLDDQVNRLIATLKDKNITSDMYACFGVALMTALKQYLDLTDDEKKAVVELNEFKKNLETDYTQPPFNIFEDHASDGDDL